MPTLVCDLRPGAAALADEFCALREAGEAVVLYWPQATPTPGMVPVADLASLDAALEDENIACLPRAANLPAWLPVSDYHRILLCTDAPNRSQLAPAETALLAALFAAGGEEVELLPAAAATDLSQSWHSGRRAGSQLITNF